jgi:hypothetical protein
MERSLFERLQQQGAPVKMLSVQYRMHPAIRQVGAACAAADGRAWCWWRLLAPSALLRNVSLQQRITYGLIWVSLPAALCPLCAAALRSSPPSTFTAAGCATPTRFATPRQPPSMSTPS